MSEVFVVGFGERGEGHDPVAVFTDPDSAVEWVGKTYGITVGPDEGGGWDLMGSINGVDQVTVTRLKVTTGGQA
jgi:hypothetical protein